MKIPLIAKFLLIAGIVSLMSGCDDEAPKHDIARDERLLKWQLTLARSEGIPTTIEEFLKLTPPVPEDQNAAPLYAKLQKKYKLLREFSSQKTGSQEEIAQAKQTIENAREVFEILDAATALKHCRFDRDWKMGMAVLYPEFAEMRSGVYALGLRASVAASEGRHDDALKDVDKMLTVARHLGEQPFYVSGYVQTAIFHISMRKLTELSFYHREEPRYALKLASESTAAPSVPVFLTKLGFSFELVNILVTGDHFKDPNYLKEVGLTEEHLPDPGFQALFKDLSTEPGSKAKVVAGFRKMWAALGALESNPKMSRKDFDEQYDLGEFELNQGLMRTLIIVKLRDSGGPPGLGHHLDGYRERLNTWKALSRALGEPQIADKIKVDDLISPFDGKPIRYSFDGKRILIDQGEKDGLGKPKIYELPRPQR